MISGEYCECKNYGCPKYLGSECGSAGEDCFPSIVNMNESEYFYQFSVFFLEVGQLSLSLVVDENSIFLRSKNIEF